MIPWRRSGAAAVAGVAAPLLAAAVAVQTPAPLQRVAWLTGCWQAVSPRRTIQETWTAPRAGTMFGVGRTFRGDSVSEYEFLVLRQAGTQLTYDAHPSGQRTATFTAPPASVSDTMVVFENPAHDFPQRVGYRRLGADSMVAWIEGTAGGRTRRVEFPYARGCDAP